MPQTSASSLKRLMVQDPGRAEAYLAFANAAGAAGLPASTGRAVVFSLLIAKPPLKVVRELLRRLLFRVPDSPLLSMLWRIVDEVGEYPHDSQLERYITHGGSLSGRQRTGYLRYLFRRDDIGPASLPFVINGMPGSASAFVCRLVAEMTGLPAGSPHLQGDFLGTGFDRSRMWDLCQSDTVVHGHLLASERTLCYFRLLGVRPIIVVRNIFDALRSYANHAAPAPGADRISEAGPGFSVMRMAGFLVEFYATWYRARNRWGLLWVEHDNLRSDPDQLIDRIVGHLRPTALSEEVIERARALAVSEAAAMTGSRSGRDDEIGVPLRSLVRALYSAYPDVDFRPIDPESGRLAVH